MSLEESVKGFTKACGKEGTVNSKTLKKIHEDCKLKGITGVDINGVDIAFAKCCSRLGIKGKTLTVDQYCKEFLPNEFAKDAASKKGGSQEDMAKKLADKVAASNPQAHGATKQSKTGNVEKMTDASQYTGAHKERFNADGTGKGMEGRKDMAANTGYTGQYKGEGSYGKK